LKLLVAKSSKPGLVEQYHMSYDKQTEGRKVLMNSARAYYMNGLSAKTWVETVESFINEYNLEPSVLEHIVHFVWNPMKHY
jgi:hypothetical protein